MDCDTVRRSGDFHRELFGELEEFLMHEGARYPREEVLQIDLHCHDFNSDKSTEPLGRILNLPETWLSTDKLLQTLTQHGCDAYTITNHNNARSIWPLKEAGADILSAAEFTCWVPDFEIYIHVLTYGFEQEQESVLNALRRSVYDFQAYTLENEIPTVWAHPLYYYAPGGTPPFEFFKRMALIFERFEVINGQCGTWQNMLVKSWVESLTPDRLEAYAKQTGVDSKRYCRDLHSKYMVAGSDSHMGIFCGLTGTYLHVPDLAGRRANESDAELAREALLECRVASFGSSNDYDKLAVAMLDYLCQVALRHEDPGLSQTLPYKGSTRDKILALLAPNVIAGVKRNKATMNFVQLFHSCLGGRKPDIAELRVLSREYKVILDAGTRVAEARGNGPATMMDTFRESIRFVHDHLSSELGARMAGKVRQLVCEVDWQRILSNDFLDYLELPIDVQTRSHACRSWPCQSDGGERNSAHGRITDATQVANLPALLDELSLPLVAPILILGAHFASTKTLYNARPMLNRLAKEVRKFAHPERALWLSDTYQDANGVSTFLRAMLKQIQSRDLPIDLLICSSTVESEDHLIVIPPISEFALPIYGQQGLRIPNVLQIHRIFLEGEYDRIVCSTEGPMGLIGLYLKHAYTVPAYFYIHTDWITFARKALKFDRKNIDHLRRILRVYYRNFDGIFVLNSDQHRWLCGGMGFSPEKVFLTAHWIENTFRRRKTDKERLFGVSPDTPVVLFAGRISREKGTEVLPKIYTGIKAAVPDVRLVVVGKGPVEAELFEKLPEAIQLGWIDHGRMPEVYSASDLLLMPSKFDAFPYVVLEAMGCGCPTVAYRSKGAKDIIDHGTNGFLVATSKDFIKCSIAYLTDRELQSSHRQAAQKRAFEDYAVDEILNRFIADIGLAAMERRVTRAA